TEEYKRRSYFLSSGFGSPIIPPPPRLHVQKSSVFSRAHVHLYIINIIALLLYVHYNTGSGEQDVPLEKSAEPQTSSATLSPELSFQLPRLEGIRVGHGQRVSLVPDGTHNMRTLSLKPLLFEIPGFLSVEESPDQLFSQLDLNQDSLLQRHKIVSLSHSTDGSWLSSYSLRKIHTGLETNPSGKARLRHANKNIDKLFIYLFISRVTRLTQLPSSLADLSEPMEVVRYEQGGYSHAHHDSSPTNHDSSCAHTHLAANTSTSKQVAISVLLHLNSADAGAETSFPVADNRTYEEEVLGDLSQQYCDKGNLKVKPVAGTALLWYNHLSDGYGWVVELDEFSLHGDCLVTRGFKWTGSVWVNIDPDQRRQEHYQRLVSWHPDGQSKKPEHGDLHQDL
uniref:Prolyl 4-hydroxylase, transmembrane a n=2 Tax=Cyprinus carpio TaxID=7962 RepID=A0A8C0YLA7_CYPCA